MRILLVNPPGPYCRAGSRWAHKREENYAKGMQYNPFPFYLAYATSVLLKEGHIADIKDCIALGWGEKELSEYVNKFKPDLIVVETSAPSYYYDLEIVKKIKCKKVAVGAHASAIAQQCLKDGYDYAVVGEYEFAISRIINGEGPIVKAKPIKDLDSLPWPPWHLMPMHLYSDPFCFGRNVAVVSSRGCPRKCNFCLNPFYYGYPNFRTRNVKKVIEEVKYLIDKYKPDEIYFDDDNITINREHITKLSKEMGKLGISWSCMGDAAVEPSIIRIMAENGCRAYKFGVESGDEKVLKRIGKNIALKDVEKTVSACKQYNIKTHATFMIGLLSDTKESIKRTIDFAISLDPDTMQFAIATPYPGTEFYKQCKERGWLLSENWEDFDGLQKSPLSYPNLSHKEIEAMCKEAWKRWDRRMLMKPKTVFHHLYGIWRRGSILSALKASIYGLKKII